MSESFPVRLAEAGLLPDRLVRLGIRRLLAQRLREVEADDPEPSLARTRAFAAALAEGPVARDTGAANEQHYELPPEFFARVLGPRRKYSCCLFPTAGTPLEEAEERMLALTCQRAGVEDGMTLLDFGCGWGSLALTLAERLPNARVLAVSNSKRQGDFIRAQAAARGLEGRLVVQTADAARFEPDAGWRFDRVLSVEMFEHMRNWPVLFGRIARWLTPEGRLFLHVFCHRDAAYPFEDRSSGDWMSRHFFTGGIMPSDSLPYLCAGAHPHALRVEAHWRVSGLHYQRTADAWLARLDAERAEVLPILARAHGHAEAPLRFHRWRLFFLACSELFGFREGREWWVSHYRLAPRAEGGS